MRYEIGNMDRYFIATNKTVLENAAFFTCELDETINKEKLLAAIEKALEFHPLFKTKAVYDKRYYLETNDKPIILINSKEEGYDISDHEADKIFEYLNKHGELSEEELNDVTGGGCNDGGSTPKFLLNQTVYMIISGYSRKCHVTWVSSSKKKYGIIFKDNTWAYNIICDEEPYVGYEKKDVPEYDLSNKSQEPIQPFTMA